MHSQENTTRKKFNFLKKYYDETWDEASHTLHVGLFQSGHDTLPEAYANATRHLVEKVCAIVPITQASEILDIGCGTGRTLMEICAQFGCAGVGVDLSDEQIRDARAHLAEMNADRAAKGEPKLRVRFVRASGSDLAKTFPKGERFTHIISQDAIMLVAEKQSLFENAYRLLAPNGVLGVADFLSEVPANTMTARDQELVFTLVNWTGELSEEAYLEILRTVGFTNVHSVRHDADMIRTYQLLADKMSQYTKGDDTTYTDLQNRYEQIVQAVKRGKMGWGFFCAQKPVRKTVLLAGTKQHSIGRYVGRALHEAGWDVWLYSRDVKKVEKPSWHERRCDIASEKSIAKLLCQIPHIDLVMMLADTGCHGPLNVLSEKSVKEFVDAKVFGSLMLTKALEARVIDAPIQLVWCAGKPTNKAKDLIAYSTINAGLASYVDALNAHYSDVFTAYYLPTGLTSPSTLGDEYIAAHGEHLKKIAQSPSVIVDAVRDILDHKYAPGVVEQKITAML